MRDSITIRTEVTERGKTDWRQTMDKWRGGGGNSNIDILNISYLCK